jgi:hypothetical protein
MSGILRACCLPSSDSPGAFGEAHEAHNEALNLSRRFAARRLTPVRLAAASFV